ncbi:M1 family metallopeptidase [Mucilaginibacter myungsuensis]|uniref:M1 family metallopeptidase n=2 Tax=Mucilaginibacter myungsuensis TaxID=649104 RepID=A0A929KUT6_9SPHI|nr:M1 family metallopeptidase [Mucilaginibacter myungsuensis]
MIKNILLAAFLGCAISAVDAQTLTQPPEVQAAFTKGTRQASGKPGDKYWQNKGIYNISVTVNPPDKTIKGTEQITYTNNSPDELKSLNMKLIMNMHRGGRTPKPEAGIQVDKITADGKAIAWDNATASKTNQMIDLPKALKSKGTVKLNIDWHFQLSDGTQGGREGWIDQTSYFLAYFYPRLSVYDDYLGWDTQEHTGGLEFYNDFNDYTLNVTVPKNFVVWATGDLQNPAKVLHPETAKKLAASLTSDSTIHIANVQDVAAKTVTAQNPTNTWTFTSKNISDVTLGLSDTYVWDGASVVVDKNTGRRASVQAAFPDKSADFHHSVQFSRNALGWFSNNWPGVPYPFSKSTAFQGTADMEYPMMVNDSPADDLAFAQLVQDHEQAHTYFPFYMGINESRYPFMDEGWATTLEYLIGISERGQQKADAFYKQFRIVGWATRFNHANEVPVITPADQVRSGQGNNYYNKPSLSYLALKDMLGDELFKKALHTYMDNWNGKHPIPWDYFNSMNTGSGKDLTWFFHNWFYTPFYTDLALESAAKGGDGYTINIKNIGGFAHPFDVVLTYADGSTDKFHQTPIVWEKDQKQVTVAVKAAKEVTSITLDNGIFMDADVKNNSWTATK